MDPLARAERRRAARAAIANALAGLDESDRRSLLEDALAEIYASPSRQEQKEEQPTLSNVGDTDRADEGSRSAAKQIISVLSRQPGRTFSVEEMTKALPELHPQRIRTELSRLRRSDVVENRGRGLYRLRGGAA